MKRATPTGTLAPLLWPPGSLRLSNSRGDGAGLAGVSCGVGSFLWPGGAKGGVDKRGERENKEAAICTKITQN
jgi:hypothetical protein